MSSRGVGTKPMLETEDNSGRIARARLERECKPGGSTPKGPPMPGIYTVQGPWKILYLAEASFTQSILVQLDFTEFKPQIGFPELQWPDPDRYDIAIYWRNHHVHDNPEQEVLPAHLEELLIHWLEEEESDFNGDTQWIWLDGPILAPKRVGKFKLMFKISRKSTDLTRRGDEAFDFAEDPLEAGNVQEEPLQDYVEVREHAEWPRLVRTRREQAQERKYLLNQPSHVLPLSCDEPLQAQEYYRWDRTIE